MPTPEWFDSASAFKLVGLDENGSPVEAIFKLNGLSVETQPSSTNAYGPKVEFLKYPFNSGAKTIIAAFSLANIPSYHKGVFTISGLATETIKVTGNYEAGASDSIAVRQASDGTLVNAATLGNGTYYFPPECPLVFDSVDFIKSAAIDPVTIKGHLMP